VRAKGADARLTVEGNPRVLLHHGTLEATTRDGRADALASLLKWGCVRRVAWHRWSARPEPSAYFT
jgi:hypothetical protein